MVAAIVLYHVNNDYHVDNDFGKTLYIGWMGVDDELKGQGIGDALVRRAMAHCVEHGAYLGTDIFNQGSAAGNTRWESVVNFVYKNHPDFPELGVRYSGNADAITYGNGYAIATNEGMVTLDIAAP